MDSDSAGYVENQTLEFLRISLKVTLPMCFSAAVLEEQDFVARYRIRVPDYGDSIGRVVQEAPGKRKIRLTA